MTKEKNVVEKECAPASNMENASQLIISGS